MTPHRYPRLSTPKLAVLVGGLLFLLTMVAVVGVVLTRNQAAHDVAQATYTQNITRWHELQQGCARSKTDRTSIAWALRAQSTYLNHVLAAASVKADVKRAARAAQRTFDASASGLESRTGTKLVCAHVYPRPAAPAGVAALP
jgi:hypothetical protein